MKIFEKLVNALTENKGKNSKNTRTLKILNACADAAADTDTKAT